MTPCICCDPEGLSKTAEAYRKAASQFNQAKSAFVKTKSGNPGFGLFMAALYPAYMRCKSATQGYLGNIGQMTERISAALKKTSDDGGDTETEIKEILETLKRILEEIEEQKSASSGVNVQVNVNTSPATGGNAGGYAGGFTGGVTGGSGFAGGVTGGTGYTGGFAGGYSGIGSSSSSTAATVEQQQTVSIPQVPLPLHLQETSTTADASTAASTAADATAANDAAATTRPRNTDRQALQTDGSLPSRTDTSFAAANHSTAGASGSIDLDVDGDGKDDYSLNLKNGGTHAVVGQDGSITVSRQKTTSVPLPPNVQATQDSYLTVDANHDGVDDIMLTGQQGQNAKISIYEQGDTEYAAVDFDHDGDYDVSVRVEDTAQTYQKMREQAEESVWQSIADKDPMGRTAEELKALYQERDIIELPQRSEIK